MARSYCRTPPRRRKILLSSEVSAPKPGRCLVCGADLDPQAPGTVWCTDCDTPHHHDCFAYAGKCAVFGCSGMRYRTATGTERATGWIEVGDARGATTALAYVVDYTSSLESFVFQGFCLALVATAWTYLGPDDYRNLTRPWSPTFFGPVTAVCIAFLILWVGLSDYRVVDGRTRKIWRHRRFLLWEGRTPEVDFSECRKLAWHEHVASVEGEQKDMYRLQLRLKSGEVIDLTDSAEGQGSPPPELVRTRRKLESLMGL